MNKQHLTIVACVVCAAFLIGCAAPKEASHGGEHSEDRIQQVITATGPKFVDCAISHCPKRTPKSIGGDEPEVRIEAPAVKAVPPRVASASSAPMQVQEQLLKSVTVHFKWNSADLGPSEKARLNELAAVLKDAKRVRVVGRTDGTGAGHANDRLANKRAMNVMLYLRDVVNGVQDNKVELSSKGLCCYVADNETNAGRSMNRRAEVQVYGDVATQEKHEN